MTLLDIDLAPSDTIRTRRRGLDLRQQEAKWGYIFISPWLIGFLIFTIVPMIASFGFSLYDFQLATPDEAHFIGFDNWERALFNDELVWKGFRVTLLFTAISISISTILSFMLAVLLNSEHLIGRNMFRTLFYAPTMVPLIASILIWNSVLNAHTGWINRFIEELTGYNAVGVDGIRWLDEPSLVYFAYTFIGLWGIGNAVLITLAGLQGVPTELYEAAKIDGAGWVRRLRSVTIPMVSPVIFYNLVLGLIGSLQYFIVPYVLNQGNGYPKGATRFYMIHLYKQAFGFANMGYGATLAWLMFIVALIMTITLFGTARYWVYYSGGEQ
jgi:multiple sugar transport system permease protein